MTQRWDRGGTGVPAGVPPVFRRKAAAFLNLQRAARNAVHCPTALKWSPFPLAAYTAADGYSTPSSGNRSGTGQQAGMLSGCITSSSVVFFRNWIYCAVIAWNRRCTRHSSICRLPVSSGHS